MPIACNIGGVWRTVSQTYGNINGVWRNTQSSCKIDGVWRSTPTGIDVTKIARVEFVIWHIEFSRSGNYYETYSVTVQRPTNNSFYAQARVGSAVPAPSTYSATAWTVPVFVLRDNSRVVMSGQDVNDNTYYAGVDATGKVFSNNSGIKMSSTVTLNHGATGLAGATSFSGIFSPTTISGDRVRQTFRNIATANYSSTMEDIRSMTAVTVTNDFTGATIPTSTKYASGLVLYAEGNFVTPTITENF